MALLKLHTAAVKGTLAAFSKKLYIKIVSKTKSRFQVSFLCNNRLCSLGYQESISVSH